MDNTREFLEIGCPEGDGLGIAKLAYELVFDELPFVYNPDNYTVEIPLGNEITVEYVKTVCNYFNIDGLSFFIITIDQEGNQIDGKKA